ncbi:Sodium-coupled monocarboxylate transporter 1 [Lamellibrachia satsuma]|nr:Sodium-coupled monocarboxylate transporter 1 [Lamellibrachia satsuma]
MTVAIVLISSGAICSIASRTRFSGSTTLVDLPRVRSPFAGFVLPRDNVNCSFQLSSGARVISLMESSDMVEEVRQTTVTGLNVWVSVLSVGVVCIFYTALGGMKAVMWTDVFQIGVMFVGLFAILIKGSLDHGGFGNIWKMMEEGDRIHFLDFDPNPRIRHTLWNLSIGAGLFWVSVYGVNQAQVQRCLSTPNLRTAQIALWLNLPGLTALLTICSLCGFVVYAQYRNCDPLTRTNPIKKDQLLPLYVIEHLDYPCIPGLFTASVFSGALSSISSGLNALAAVTLQDLVRPYCLPRMKESTAANVSKGIAVGFGVLMILLTYVASHLGGVLQLCRSNRQCLECSG